jgi:hypothetical protein
MLGDKAPVLFLCHDLPEAVLPPLELMEEGVGLDEANLLREEAAGLHRISWELADELFREGDADGEPRLKEPEAIF